MKAISSELIIRIDDFDPQNLSNTLWAVSRFGLCDCPLVAALSKHSRLIISEFDVQNLQNTAWSLATLGILDRPLLDAISAQAIRKITAFSSQGLANMVWAYDVLSYDLHTVARASAPYAVRFALPSAWPC